MTLSARTWLILTTVYIALTFALSGISDFSFVIGNKLRMPENSDVLLHMIEYALLGWLLLSYSFRIGQVGAVARHRAVDHLNLRSGRRAERAAPDESPESLSKRHGRDRQHIRRSNSGHLVQMETKINQRS